MSEREYQRWIINHWTEAGINAQNVHPSAGMKAGIPDTLVCVESGVNWFELKFGHHEGHHIRLSHVLSADQRRWHRNWHSSGGESDLLIGVGKGKVWDTYLVERSLIKEAANRRLIPLDWVTRVNPMTLLFGQDQS